MLRRRQYKLRFQKWQLPNLEAFTARQGGSSCSHTIAQSVSSDDLYQYLAMSEPQSVIQNAPESGGPVNNCQPACSNDDHKDQASSTIFDSDLALLNCSSFKQPGAENEALTSTVTVTRPSSKDMAARKEISHSSSLAERIRAVGAADKLLAGSSSEQVYLLCGQWWDSMWSNHTEAAGLPALVSVISNMSRAATTSQEILQVVAKMEQLIAARHQYNGSDPKGEVALHTNLASLLLRLQHFGTAACHLQLALKVMLENADPVLEDWQESVRLVYHCALHGPQEFHQSVAEKLWTEFQHGSRMLPRWSLHHSYHWQALFASENSLCKLFSWCAEKFLLPGFSLYLANRFNAALTRHCILHILARILQDCLYQQYDEYTNKDIWAIRQLYIHRWAQDICNCLNIVSKDFLAIMVLILMNLISPRNIINEIKDAMGANILILSVRISILLVKINRTVLDLINRSQFGILSGLLKSFLTTRTVIGLNVAAI